MHFLKNIFLVSLLMPAAVLAAISSESSLPTSASAEPTALVAKINADRVNLRSAADTNSEVVAQADYGLELDLLDVQGDWVKVRPPKDVLFWVHRNLVRENRVSTKILNVRTGSGVNHDIAGQLERNAEMEVVTNRMEWIGIRPPPGMGLWVYHELVELPKPPPLPEPPPPPVVRIPKPASPVVSSVPNNPVHPSPSISRPIPPPPPSPPPPPPDLNLVPLAGQGSLSTRTGVVRAYLFTAGKPSRFRLVLSESAGIDQAVCMIKGDEDMIRPWMGRKVLLKGRDYWVQGEKLPVTVPEDIQSAEK